MCNWLMEANRIYNTMGGMYVEESFPPEFIQRFPPNAAQPGHCLACRRPLDYYEMYPTGKTPRYMCDPCYENIALSGPKQVCLTCGEQLPPHQIRNRIQYPRELTHAFHPGPCKDYHLALAGIVFGIPFKTNQVPMLPNYGNNTNSLRGALFLRPRASDVIHVASSKPNRIVKRLKFLE